MDIFIDASAFIALWNADDTNHKAAITKSQTLVQENAQVFTSNIVVCEVLTVLSLRISKQKALEFGETVFDNGLNVVLIDEDLQHDSWEIFRKIAGKNVSFFDCTAFALMQSVDVKKVFSFDQDFKKQGFYLV
ncbi:hypothetical protein COS81_02740 [candidate division WWE3 bacterium CG06_land_8_20_14_3_00_42_16]|uniref:PIN domain-containing protein n=4 Tax=Katanobacteria TaxID=422282 RepID=A0A2M7AN00_UNCKA|nr:MAG: hypothetical protein COS81_02740 [candidate division WWE3 bacterium CG06_land_8_20_14_3_00_42_16]PIZ42134.1 MAG: hypothetical protein COY34_03400 [candidate division WWE3 bacterium CG_4_10_14_0_2_um_filter_42_8]PJA38054.1 MAG: hypothetical protein CO181_01280 [candidate division WWE3 bacterium CG_4_9_14_3_um_filter_43_9]PJC68736.1 MAG: hypothetical protein CO015_02990 [candidate division WWE3 bacterium CG_4_8_14_3_um_filter_42_11]